MTAQLVYSGDLDTANPEELVKGLLPRGPAVAIAYGPPHCGKSFTFSTELPLMIQAGRPFLGRDVIQGTTVLALGEGLLGAGVRKACRLDFQAQQDAAAGPVANDAPALTDDHMLILTESWPLAITRDGKLSGAAEKVISDLQPVGDLELLVLDSLGDYCKGAALSNESAATRIMEGARETARRLGCLVLLIHHTTKTGLMLGSDRIRAAADVVISVTPEQGGRDSSVITCEKMRYAERFAPFAVEAVPHSWDEPVRDDAGEVVPGETFRASSFVTRLRTDAGAPVTVRPVVPEIPRAPRRNGLRPRLRSVPDQLAAARARRDLTAGLLSVQCPECGRPGGGMSCDVKYPGSKLIPVSLSPVRAVHTDRAFAAWEAGRITETELNTVLAAA